MSIARIAQLVLWVTLSAPMQVHAQPRPDADFLRHATQLGLAEMAASKMALVKAKDTQTKQFADMVLADHTKLAEQLEALAREAEVELPVGLSLRQKLALRVLRDGSDEKFDERYAENFGVKAYERTIRLFSAAAAGADDPNVKAFAQTALPWLRQRLATAKALGQANDNGPASRWSWMSR